MKENLTFLREALRYTTTLKGKTIVIKLGKSILEQMSTLGIVQDIQLLKDLGVNIVIAHDICLEQLVSSTQYGQQHHKDILASILDAFKDIPRVFCAETNDLSVDEVVARVATEHHADKLIFFTRGDGVFDHQDGLIQEATAAQAHELVQKKNITGSMRNKLLAAIYACEHHTPRVHIINGIREGTLITELFTCKGIGTMIYDEAPYQEVREATAIELPAIANLLQEQDSFINDVIPAEVIARHNHFFVFTVDGRVHGCMVMENGSAEIIEIAYLAASTAYQAAGVIKKLIEFGIEYAKGKLIKHVTIDSAKNTCWLRMEPWFFELGFTEAPFTICPKNHHNTIWAKQLAV
ncbi:MAG: GNAT family N-acetyltransferase [bacterium]